MAEQLAVKAKMDVDVAADAGQVRFHVKVADETLVAVRLEPEQALALAQELIAGAFDARSRPTQPPEQAGSDV